jgi:sulfite reductase (NADPH) flavoprotein alpha-component
MATTGVSTPVSTTSTLSIPSSPPTKFAPLSPFEKGTRQPSHPASTIVEYISSRAAHSSTVFVYDLAEQAGFGALTKEWSRSTPDTAAPTISLQTRDGAGLSLAGRLSQGTSKDAAKTSVLTAYTTPVGLAAMAQSLTYLPTASANGRLVLQVRSFAKTRLALFHMMLIS